MYYRDKTINWVGFPGLLILGKQSSLGIEGFETWNCVIATFSHCFKLFLTSKNHLWQWVPWELDLRVKISIFGVWINCVVHFTDQHRFQLGSNAINNCLKSLTYTCGKLFILFVCPFRVKWNDDWYTITLENKN